ncbi:MAG: class I SAM-dependent methyltransferase [Parvularculaceae bacterium]
MAKRCLACDGGDLSLAMAWRDWVAACAKRPDGPGRLAAAEACGVAAAAPDLLACADCGAISMAPVPGDDQLAAFYQNYHATDDFVRKARKKTRRAIRRLLPFRLLAGAGASFLEVGASIGVGAEAARRLGFRAVAQEIDANAVARGGALHPRVEFICGPLDDAAARGPFDMIYCAEVIEHVPSPRSFAAQLYALAAPGARLFLTTPDAGHPRRPALDRWGSVKPPEHVTLFTKRALTTVFENAGFERPRFFPYAKPGVRMVARRRT